MCLAYAYGDAILDDEMLSRHLSQEPVFIMTNGAVLI